MTTSYLDRALQAAGTARRDRDAGDFNAACNRAYYAMFYAVHGPLEAFGEDTLGKTHATTLRLFSQRMVASGEAPPELARALAVAQNLRSRADYRVEGATAKDAEHAIAAMDSLIEFARPILNSRKQGP